MKNFILTVCLILVAGLTSAQSFDLFSATVTKEGSTYTIKDTSGTPGNLSISQTVMDSVEFTRMLFDRVYGNVRQIASAQVRAELMQREVNKYQSLLSGQGLLSAYLEYVNSVVSFSGDWRVSYNSTSTNLTVGEDENMYTQGGAKVVNVLQIADNHMRLTLITMDNEKIDLYQVNETLWWGEGVNGEMLLRKL